ncbi:MAG: hypothetical protein IH842_01355 [Thaumarchaeota archaeon]|nr:hypothetical protein [Nitrososphaerota archaeon]
MLLSQIKFGSFLSYSPRGSLELQSHSRTVRSNLKNDVPLDSGKLMSITVAEQIKRDLDQLPFADLFQVNPILIPTPSSSLTRVDTLWVPHCIATALVGQGLGRSVETCLQRVTPLQKASTSRPENRPKPIEHYDSMVVQTTIHEHNEILLVDDIITRGSTLLGAASKLVDTFPNAHINAFAVMRTVSTPQNFERIIDPREGTITLVGENTFRDP